jgi:hypothetical protein
VYVFARSGEAWSERQMLGASDSRDDDGFGWSLALRGTTLFAGGFRAGYVLARTGERWEERQRIPSVGSSQIALTEGGETAVVSSGEILERRGAAFEVTSKIERARPELGDSVAADGASAAIGVPGEAGRGAVYVLAREEQRPSR